MADPYIGELKIFGGNFAPVGWMFCDGRLLAISEYEALFNLIGTTYGGDGVSTFALPDLRGRIPLHQGAGYVMGQAAGSATALAQASVDDRPRRPTASSLYIVPGAGPSPRNGRGSCRPLPCRFARSTPW